MKVFVYKWPGERTGWDYKLTIYGAGASRLDANTVEIVNLPPGCLSVKKRPRIEYDGYPVGAHTFHSLEIEVDFENFDETIGPDFIPLIIEPDVSLGAGWTFDAAPKLNLIGGTIFKLEVTYYGASPEPWTDTLFIGMHRQNTEVEHDLLVDKGTFIVVDIAKYVMEAVMLDRIYIVLDFARQGPVPGLDIDPEVKTSHGIIEAAWVQSGKPYIFGHTDKTMLFHFVKRSAFHGALSYTASCIAKNFTRTDEGLSINFPAISHFKQTFTGDGALGDSITEDDLWMIAQITNGQDSQGHDVTIGGLFVGDGGDLSLYSLYPDTAWDYLNDYCQEFAHKIDRSDPASIDCVPVFSKMTSTPVQYSAIPLNEQFLFKARNPKLISSYAILKKAESSLTEALSDGDWGDAETAQIVMPGSRNDQGFTIPILWNNLPSGVSYHDNDPRFATVGSSGQRRNNKPHTLGLYYFDAPTFLQGTVPNPIRVHEYIQFRILTDPVTHAITYSQSLPGCAFTEWGPGYDKYGQAQGMGDPAMSVFELQNLGVENGRGIPQLVAHAYVGLFGGAKQMKLSFEIDLQDYTSYFIEPGKLYGFPWWGMRSVFKLNISNINPYYVNPNQYWYMLSSEIDFETETASVELILRTI